MKGALAAIPVMLLVTSSELTAQRPSTLAQSEVKYEGLVQVANEICLAPLEYGGTATMGAKAGIDLHPTKLGAGAVLSRILTRFIGVDISGSLKVSGNAWYGILQKDLAQAQTSRNACAERVFGHLFDTFHISNKTTLKVLPKPTNISSVYRTVDKRVTSNSANTTNIINNGYGSQSVLTGGGNRVINGNGNTINELSRADRSHYIKLLQNAYSRGSDILVALERGPVTDASIDRSLIDTNSWIGSVYNQLMTEMTPVAAKSFVNIQPLSRAYGGLAGVTPQSEANYGNMRDALPEYLANLKYLMEHDTMDPQNAGN